MRLRVPSSIRLIAISVGTPRDVEINGRQVSTSIIKTKVKGPVYISVKGPAGDKPAVHPDAVYVLPIEHYDYWASELGADRHQWLEGFFGENFTIEGIDETQLRVGDILQVGSRAKFTVASSRIPCSKLSWRLGQSEEFLRRFSLSGKTGFYLKVIEEGCVEAGDEVIHHVVDEKAITVADLSRFYVTVDEASEDQLYHVLSHEHLSLTSQQMLRRRLATINDLSLMKKGRWSGWRDFVLEKVTVEAKDMKSFWLVPVDRECIAGYRPGQFLTCLLTLANGESLIRTWTIADFDPSQGC